MIYLLAIYKSKFLTFKRLDKIFTTHIYFFDIKLRSTLLLRKYRQVSTSSFDVVLYFFLTKDFNSQNTISITLKHGVHAQLKRKFTAWFLRLV